MEVGSYLEVFTTIFGWLLYDNVWSVLSATGIAYIPFFIIVIKNFAEPYKSQEAKDAASVSQRRMELDVIAMFVVIVLVAQPFMSLQLSSVKYASACTSAGGSGGSTGTTFDSSFTTASLGSSVAKIPVWWYMTLNLSGALNATVIAGIPCAVDIRQVKYEINNIRILDDELKDQLERFHGECYLEALADIASDRGSYNTAFNAGSYDEDDKTWLGSHFMRNNSTLYADQRAKSPVNGFPFNAARDIEYTAATAPINGHPTCKSWWEAPTKGLLARLENEIPSAKNAELTLFGNLTGDTLADVKEDAVQVVLENNDIALNSLRRLELNGFGHGLDDIPHQIFGEVGGFFSKATIKTVQNIMPSLQALILMFIYFLLPFILVMSGYAWGAIFTATFVIFGLKFLSPIYAVLFWLDEKLFSAITARTGALNNLSNSDDRGRLTGETYVDITINIMWLLAPALWMGMIGWAGYRANVDAGSSAAKGVAEKGANTTVNAIKK